MEIFFVCCAALYHYRIILFKANRLCESSPGEMTSQGQLPISLLEKDARATGLQLSRDEQTNESEDPPPRTSAAARHSFSSRRGWGGGGLTCG